MFRRTATEGRKASIVSSWKLETSTTAQSCEPPAALAKGVPRFPPMKTRGKTRDAMSPNSVVTVDLPFVPVTAATFPPNRRKPSSSSPHTGVPARTSAGRGSFSLGTPGERTTSGVSSAAFSVILPWTNAICGGTGCPRDRSTASFGRSSKSVTRAPSRRRRRAETNPEIPAPITNASLPPKVSISPYLEGADGQQRQDDRDDPETNDDLRLRPSLEFEVVVDRRHPEDPLPGGLVGEDLKNHRESLHHEHPPHQDDLLLHHHGHDAERGTQGKRPGVPHEHLGGIGVEPEKADPRPGHGATEDGELPRPRDIGNLQVVRDLHVPGEIREQHVGPGGDDGRADGKPVETVGQIDGVRRPYDHQDNKRDVQDPQSRVELLEKGDAHLVLDPDVHVDQRRRHSCEDDLAREFCLRAQALRILPDDLLEVVEEADCPISDGHENRDPYIGVREVRPEQGRDHDGDDDQEASHRRGSLLREVSIRPVPPDGLPDLVGAELADKPRPEDETQEERGDRGVDRAERDVPEHVEKRILHVQREEQVVQHQTRPTPFPRPRRSPRAAFLGILSPG